MMARMDFFRKPITFGIAAIASALVFTTAHCESSPNTSLVLPTLVPGMTVAAKYTLSVRQPPPRNSTSIGFEMSGNQGVVIGGPVNADGAVWWQVAFNDNLTGWTDQDGLAEASVGAPILPFSASPAGVAYGSSATLTWSSTNATSCSGTGFSPSGISGSQSVSPSDTTTYVITCTGSGGVTVRSATVAVNPLGAFSWSRSLPVTFADPGIVPFGGTETRFLLFMDGSLYAGIGDWEDPQLANPKTTGAQVLRLDSANGSWVEDQNFIQAVTNSQGKRDYQAVSALGTAHFDRDVSNNPITPIDVLMAGFYNYDISGVSVLQKIVTTGSIGAQGKWIITYPVPPPAAGAYVRSFGTYTDSVTGKELAFAGADAYGIFSGGFNPASNTVAWGSAEAGSAEIVKSFKGTASDGGRVMAFAACGGKLYASIYDAIVVRADGPNPSWSVLSRYSGTPGPGTSGFRGLTCVPNLHGSGSMLIASLEGQNIYEIALDGSIPTVELYMDNHIAT